jgi:hypothetical protein
MRTAAIQTIADTVRVATFGTEAAPVQPILDHIGEPAAPPRIAQVRGLPAWEDAPEPVPDWDCFGQPEPDFAFDQSVAW